MIMDKNRFEIVFEKVAEAKSEDGQISQVELESKEIAELRRIVLEVTAPEPKFFTGT
jgi:membrane-associated HD superfamily phosphohydrolase